MEPSPSENKTENFFEKYPFLLSILNEYKEPYDKKGMNMKEYLVKLHRIIFKRLEKSNQKKVEAVEKVENLFSTLIENLIKLDDDSILFKALSFFIRKGFALFVSALQGDQLLKKAEFSKRLLETLNIENIAQEFKLKIEEIENELSPILFQQTVNMMKFKFEKKINSYILLFFKKLVQQGDKEITDYLSKYMTQNDIDGFFKNYKLAKFEKKLNLISIKKVEEKKEANEIILEPSENNKNLAQDSTKATSENSSDKGENGKQNSNILIEVNLLQVTQKVQQAPLNENKDITSDMENEIDNKNLLKMIKELKDKFQENNKNWEDKFQETNKNWEKKFQENNKNLENNYQKNWENKCAEFNGKIQLLNDKIKALNDKLDLSILINNLSGQRDSYKKALEILLIYLKEELNLELDLKGEDDIWKKAKKICDNISKSNALNKHGKDKLIGAINSLLFCKDYANCLVHGKGIFSEELKKYYKQKDVKQILPISSFNNMNTATTVFFGQTVNYFGEFKIINKLILNKIKKWRDDTDMNYSDYFSGDTLLSEKILFDLGVALSIFESFELNQKS